MCFETSLETVIKVRDPTMHRVTFLLEKELFLLENDCIASPLYKKDLILTR